MSQGENERSLIELYNEIDQKMNKVYKYVTVAYETYRMPISYGCGPKLSQMEVHTLSMIGSNPGVTLTEIRDMFGGYHSLSAIYQHVKKLLDNELIYQLKRSDDDKKKCLYLTESGERVHEAHIRFDIAGTNRMMSSLLRDVTMEEMDTFFKVAGVWSDVFIAYKKRLKTSADAEKTKKE